MAAGTRRATLLVVDDLEDYLRSLESALCREWNTVCAHSLAEAQATITATRCDIALIDVRLSETDHTNRDGIKLLEWIRERSPSTATVMMSGYRESEAAVEALGEQRYLRKPIDLRELKTLLRSLIGES